jgi:outer membrane receptor for ferrienterochelin and colicin
MIERVEIIKGPASSLYGSDAMSGVINVITRTAPEKPTGSASTAFGTYNTRIYRLSQGTKFGKFGYFLSYNHRESDGPDTTKWILPDTTVIDTKKWEKFKDDCFEANLGYEFTPCLSLNLKTGYFQREQVMDPPDQQRYNLNLLGKYLLSEVSNLNLRASLFKYQRFFQRRETDIYHKLYEAELNYNTLIKNNLLTLGYHYCKEYHTHFKFDPNQESGTKSQLTNSFFAQDEMEFLPLSLVMGTRIDHHDKWGLVVNPNVGLLCRLTKDFKLRGSVGRAFKEPPMCHLYTVDLFQVNHWVRANPDLKPEKSWGYQLGVEYEMSENILSRVFLFRNDIKDLIEIYDTGESQMHIDFTPYPIFSYRNIAKIYTQGLEFTIQRQFSDWESVRLGYTWLESKDKETNEDLFYNPKHKLNIEFEVKVDRYDLWINLRGEYIGMRWGYYIEPGVCPGTAGEPDPKKLKSYSLAHIKVNKNIYLFPFLTKQAQAQLFISINNIFDEEYVEWGMHKMSGREFLGGIRFKF